MSNFDYSALNASTQPSVTATQLPPSNKKYILVIVAFLVGLSLVNGILIPGLLSRESTNLSSLFPVLFINVIIISVMAGVYVQQKMHVAKAEKLLRFAENNRLSLVFDQKPTIQTGVIFNTGWDRLLREGVKGEIGSQEFELSTYRHVIGHARSARSYRYTYLMVTLNQQFPSLLFHNRRVKRWGVFGQISWIVRVYLRKISLANTTIGRSYTIYEVQSGEKTDQERALGVLAPVLERYADRYSFEVNKNQLYVYKRGADNLSKEEKLREWLTLANELTNQLR